MNISCQQTRKTNKRYQNVSQGDNTKPSLYRSKQKIIDNVMLVQSGMLAEKNKLEKLYKKNIKAQEGYNCIQ